MSDLPPIPGLHRRSCPHCGAALTLTDEQAMETVTGRFVDRHETVCPHCREVVSYTVASGSSASTEKDTTGFREFRRRVARLFGRGT